MKLFSRSTFQGKLLVLFLLFSILPLTVVALIVYQTVRDRYESALQVSFRESALLQEKLITSFFENTTVLVRSIAAQDILLSEIEKAGSGEAFDNSEVFVSLSSVRRENPFIEKLYILNASGNVIVSTALSEVESSLANDPAFYVPIRERTSYTGRVTTSSFGKRIFTVSAPLVKKGDNSIVGVLVMELNTSIISTVMKTDATLHEQRTQEDARDQSVPRSFVVDADGYLLTWLPDIGFSDRIQTLPVLRCQSQHLGSEGLWDSYNGKQALGVSRCMSFGDFSWTLVVEQDASDAFAVSQQLGLVIISITLVVGLILIFVIIAISHSVTDPIRILQRGAKELGQGNFGYRISLKTGDELEELANDFEETRKRLRLAREKEASLGRMKSEFISIAAHQLRTPLTGIKWSLEEFFKDAKNNEHVDLRRALSNVYAMIKLVNELLDVTRIEEGRFTYTFKKGDFIEFVKRCAREIQPRLAANAITLVVNPPPSATPLIVFDEERMRMVLFNILDNALKYTKTGGTITISYEVKETEVHVAVQDTGIGIPADQIGNIFTKFFRAENAVQMQTSGSGLGLFVVQQIVKAHGGTAWITSKEGKGTAVHFSMPFEGRK